MLVIPSNSPASGGGGGGYGLTRSLRFRGGQRLAPNTVAAGDTLRHTLSFWLKRGAFGTNQTVSWGYRSADDGDIGMGFDASDAFFIKNGAGTVLRMTSALYRDPSAWYHFVVAFDTSLATATNRIRIYVNGVEVTAFSTNTAIAQNLAISPGNNGCLHYIGIHCLGDRNYIGLMAEFISANGTQHPPTMFGEFDTITGVWKPKQYTGTYGAPGYYLPFTDNTSVSTGASNTGIGKDFSGNGRLFEGAGGGAFSLTPGPTYDSFTDVPTLTSATASNFAVLNPVGKIYGSTLSDGNLFNTQIGVNEARGAFSTFGVSAGKMYFEFVAPNWASALSVGVMQTTDPASATQVSGDGMYGWGIGSSYGWTLRDGVWTTNLGTAFSTTTIGGIAIDFSTSTMTIYRDGVSMASFSIPSGSTWYAHVANGTIAATGTAGIAFNFGQRPFSFLPSGYTGWNTFNLPDPVIKKPNTQFDVSLYTGNGATQTITNAGFQPDLVWVQKRSIAENGRFVDVANGVGNAFNSVADGSASEPTGVTAFNSTGFAVGAHTAYNASAGTYVAWQWKKGATPGFDVIPYSGNSSTQTVNHSLGVVPTMAWIMCKGAAGFGNVTNDRASGSWAYMKLTAPGAYPGGSIFASNPTSSSLFLPNNVINATGRDYVVYLWAEIPGFSKFGVYVGNGAVDGPFVYCGFKPKFVIVKTTNSAGNWLVMDTVRDPSNPLKQQTLSDTGAAEAPVVMMSAYSNGFKQVASNSNNNSTGVNYLYMAFAENPFKYSLAR